MLRTLKYILLCISLLSYTANANSENAPPGASKLNEDQSAVSDDKQPSNQAISNQNLEMTTSISTAVTSSTPIYVLPARTVVLFTLNTPISSKTAVAGEQFQLLVADNVLQNGVTIIPKGTPAFGEVIHASKAGGLGKAGELLVTIRYIDLNGQKIKMRSFQPFQGKGQSNTIATISAVTAISTIPYAGLLTAFIQGGNIEMPAQTLVQALIATETVINPMKKSVPIDTLTTESKPLTTNNQPGESK